jgi:hypothetical protein
MSRGLNPCKLFDGDDDDDDDDYYYYYHHHHYHQIKIRWAAFVART